jgi:hypothetical protein
MANKPKTITLEFPAYYGDDIPRKQGYAVAQITESVDFTPGQVLTKEETDILCHSREWKVTVRRSK